MAKHNICSINGVRVVLDYLLDKNMEDGLRNVFWKESLFLHIHVYFCIFLINV